MPNITVESKRDILRNMGAELHLVDAKPYSDPGNYQRVSENLAQKLEKETEKTFGLVNLKILQIINSMKKLLQKKYLIKLMEQLMVSPVQLVLVEQ